MRLQAEASEKVTVDPDEEPVTAWRSEPAPESLQFVTAMLDAPATPGASKAAPAPRGTPAEQTRAAERMARRGLNERRVSCSMITLFVIGVTPPAGHEILRPESDDGRSVAAVLRPAHRSVALKRAVRFRWFGVGGSILKMKMYRVEACAAHEAMWSAAQNDFTELCGGWLARAESTKQPRSWATAPRPGSSRHRAELAADLVKS